jgi:hypothetical protein
MIAVVSGNLSAKENLNKRMTTENKHNCKDINRTNSDIEKYGLSVILIEATDYLPSFAYSIGLWTKFNHPEIICFGLGTQTLHSIINDVAELVKSGQKIETNKTYNNIFENSKAEFVQIDKRNLADYFGTAIDFYNSNDFPVIQLVWTDRNDKFPWETDFEDEFIYKQPLLDRNADFKFFEAKNVTVFTTRQFLELGKPILRAIHDNDGDWQFLTGDQMPEDAKLAALEQMIIKDKTLNEIFDLEYGEEAEREFIGGKWTRNMVEIEDDE